LFARGGVSALGLAVLTGCVEDDDSPSSPTATPESTTEAEPTPTQDAIASPVPAYQDATKWLGRTLSIATWGGDFESAQSEAFFRPFEAQTGVQIQTKNADIARMIDQVDTQSVSWDLMTVEMGRVLSLAREGYLTPIDYRIVDSTPLIPEFALQHGVGMACYSTVLVYSPALVDRPDTWADFWDVGEPAEDGTFLPAQVRTLPHTAVGTLEFALLADGVSVNDLYPLDVDRAFAKLGEIYDNVAIWYEDGKLPIEMTIAGQAGMAAGWNVRVDQFAAEDPIDMVWEGGMIAGDAWVIPSGAPNADVAIDFINFATRAIPGANFSRLVPYGPVNLASFDLIRPDRHPLLPTSPENLDVQFIQNWNWWSDNLDDVQARFNQWIIDGPPAST
jgi:putative spermidine/putrescine transport system substrate-binding protein